MDTNKNRDTSNREDQPRNIDPEEVNAEHPGKAFKAQQKIKIKESGFGREQGQTPADEHIEHGISQIDPGTIELHKKEAIDSKHEVGERDTMDVAPRKANEIDSVDNRDHSDSTRDWNAEHNQTGRRK